MLRIPNITVALAILICHLNSYTVESFYTDFQIVLPQKYLYPPMEGILAGDSSPSPLPLIIIIIIIIEYFLRITLQYKVLLSTVSLPVLYFPVQHYTSLKNFGIQDFSSPRNFQLLPGLVQIFSGLALSQGNFYESHSRVDRQKP